MSGQREDVTFWRQGCRDTSSRIDCSSSPVPRRKNALPRELSMSVWDAACPACDDDDTLADFGCPAHRPCNNDAKFLVKLYDQHDFFSTMTPENSDRWSTRLRVISLWTHSKHSKITPKKYRNPFNNSIYGTKFWTFHDYFSTDVDFRDFSRPSQWKLKIRGLFLLSWTAEKSFNSKLFNIFKEVTVTTWHRCLN